MTQKKSTILFLSVFILVGVGLLCFGIINTINTDEQSKNYETITATYIGNTVYSSDEDGTTYRLIYSYFVNNQEYTVSTDYGTGAVPALGSTKDIKYNPDNPNEAVIPGVGINSLFLFLGFMFIAVPLIPIITSGKNNNTSNNQTNSIKDRLPGAFTAFVFAILGFGTYYLICAGSNSLSPIVAFQSAGIFIIVPILFVVVGIYGIWASLFPKKGKNDNSGNRRFINHSKSKVNLDKFENNSSRSDMDVTSSQHNILENILDLLSRFGEKAYGIYVIIGGLIFSGFCTWVFIMGGDTVTKIVIIPFLVCGVAIIVTGISLLLGKSMKIGSLIYISGFFTFWFGFLIFWDYIAITQGEIGLFLFSLIFWAAGIFVLYNNLKK